MGNRSSYGQLSRSLTISSAYTIEYNAEEGENTDSVKTNGTLVYENKLANNAPANTYDAEKPEFEIDENGVLTQYNGEGGEVVLPETVKEIAYGVFSNNSITKVTVNEGCVKIGSNVFANARNLREAVLPSTLEYIDYSAFAGAIRLEKINLEDTKVNYYGGNCFMYTALKEITVPSAGTEITMGVNAIAYMPKLTKATVNADVNTLSGIFVGCTKLEEVVLNGKVGLITNYSFCDNAGIKKLVFNNEIGQIGDEYITRIDDYDSPIGSVAKVFCSMSSLEEVVFNSDIGGFYGYAFNANPSLCKVVFGGNVGHFSPYAFQYNQKLTHFELAEGNDNFVYDAETGLLYNKDKTEVYKPGEWDYDGIFEVPETLAELPRLSEASSVCLKVWTELKISDEGCSNNLREWTGDPAGYREELDMPLLKGVIVPEKFTEIPNNFLYCHSGVTSVEIKGAITKIGRNAFAKTSISSFTVPETVKEILHYAFKGCAKLESIEFNDGLEKWGTNNNRFFEEFNGCSSLKEIRIPSVITGFMYKTFGDCTSLERVYLHDNVNYISGFGNFSNCTNLKEIISGATWSEVPYNTFENCENLVRIDPIGEGLKTIDTKAFLNCSKLNIRIPSTVTRINEKAFSGCASMKIVDIPAAVTSIDFADIFAGCTAIKEYNVAEDNAAYSSVDGVVYTKDGETLLVYPLGKEDASFIVASGAEIIGEKAFENARYLKEIFLADVIEIDDGAFANSAVTTVSGDKLAYVGDEAFKDVSTLIGIDLQAAEYIGADAFRNTGLTEALIGNYTEFIGGFAFADCASLTTVRVEANACAFDYPTVFEDCEIEIFNVDEDNGHFTVDDHGCIYSKDYSILYRYVGEGEKNVIVNEGVTYIAADAFLGNEEIESVVLPSTLRIVGDRAFYGCVNLGRIEFRSGKAPVLYGRYTEGAHYPYANFISQLDENAPLDVEFIAPDDDSYKTVVWTLYFRA